MNINITIAIAPEVIARFATFPEKKSKPIKPKDLPQRRKPWSLRRKKAFAKRMKGKAAWNKGQPFKVRARLQKRVGKVYARKTDALFVIPVAYRGLNTCKK